MDGQTDGQTNEQKISPFYRTSSPIGAAAPLQPNFNLKTIKRGKGTADHMMPLGAWFILGEAIQIQNDLAIHPYIPS